MSDPRRAVSALRPLSARPVPPEDIERRRAQARVQEGRIAHMGVRRCVCRGPAHPSTPSCQAIIAARGIAVRGRGFQCIRRLGARGDLVAFEKRTHGKTNSHKHSKPCKEQQKRNEKLCSPTRGYSHLGGPARRTTLAMRPSSFASPAHTARTTRTNENEDETKTISRRTARINFPELPTQKNSVLLNETNKETEIT